MSFSILSYLLATERLRPRAASGAGFSIPAMSERGVPEGLDPILVTSARGRFVVTKRNREGMARFGFTPCTLEEEPAFFLRLCADLRTLSEASKWPNRFKSPSEAITAMRRSRFNPKSLVMPRGVLHPDSEEVPVQQGKFEGLQVLSADLPTNRSILVSDSAALGVYVRVGDYLGLQLYNVDQTVAIIETDELAI
jgi:hypothetical protein